MKKPVKKAVKKVKPISQLNGADMQIAKLQERISNLEERVSALEAAIDTEEESEPDPVVEHEMDSQEEES